MNTAYRVPPEGFLTRELVAPGAANPANAGGPSVLTHYWRVAVRRRWLIAAIVLTVLILAFVVTMFMTPLYRATATIQISREEEHIVNVEGLEPDQRPVAAEFYETQYSLLKARSLAERVAKELKLADSPTFFQAFGVDPDQSLVNAESAHRLTAAERDKREELVINLLLKNIQVEPIRGSALVQVSFTSADPALSQNVANAWTQQFIASNLDRRFDATAYARRYLEQRLDQLRQKLEDSERQLVQYASAQRIVTVQTGTTGDAQATAAPERPLISDDLVSLNDELNKATADRIRAASRLGSAGSSPEILNNAALADLRRRRAEVAADYANTLAKFSPEYPATQALAAQIKDFDRSIAAETARLRGGLESDYQDAVRREQVLRANVERLKSGTLDLRRRNIQYTILQREADTNRQLYDALLQRYKEIGVAGGVGVNNVLIVDQADLPRHPSSPNLPLNIALALVLGMLFAAAAVFALEQMDEAIKDVDDARRMLPVPVLGVTPAVAEQDPYELLGDRKSALSEAYLSIHTTLAFSTDHGMPKSLAVTSTRAGEAKSTTSYALAHSLFRTGKKVILIDADMRSPSVHHFVGLENDRGVSNFLAGDDALANLTRQVEHAAGSGVDVMLAGPQPPSAAELLTGGRLHLLVTRLLADYDHVVVDSPPVLGLADAPLIASQVEAIVFAVEANGPGAGSVTSAIERLRQANANVVGVVLTKFEQRKAQYGYGYDYGYRYGQEDAEAKA